MCNILLLMNIRVSASAARALFYRHISRARGNRDFPAFPHICQEEPGGKAENIKSSQTRTNEAPT